MYTHTCSCYLLVVYVFDVCMRACVCVCVINVCICTKPQKKDEFFVLRADGFRERVREKNKPTGKPQIIYEYIIANTNCIAANVKLKANYYCTVERKCTV